MRSRNQTTLRWLLWAITACLAAMLSGSATGESDEVLEGALIAYAEGMQSEDRNIRIQRFTDSERLFQAALSRTGPSAALWTNLGNAALQAERPGSAILAYRRALILDPAYARAKKNLAHARERMPDWVPTPGAGGLFDTFFFWHNTLARSTRTTAAALCFVGLCALLAGSLLLRLPLLRYPAFVLGVIWVALIASVLADPSRFAHLEAVVTVPEAQARAADSINAPLRFGQSLPEGAEVRILEDRGGWLHIELQNGRDGWLTTHQVTRVAEEEP
ncbi:MAG: tetratricopeptide repeat protein [Myxococcota bacterium]|nr:tetratricopeptide repeat protein [Myxococcota bacterium]